MHALQVVTKRRVATAAAVVAVGAVTLALASSSQVGAEVISDSDSAELTTLPSSTTLELDQFDPALGTLTKVTITATLDGSVSTDVTNLGLVAEQTTVTFNAGADISGPVVGALEVEISDAETLQLAGGATTNVTLTDDDASVTTSTDPAGLAAFTGTGVVDYELVGHVEVTVVGPSAWRTDGVATAEATLQVEYEYTPGGGSTTTTTQPAPTTTTSTTTTTTSPPTTTSTTTTLPPTTTSTTTTLPPTTTTTLPPTTTTTLPPTTTTLPPTTTTLPEPEGCPPSYWGQSGVGGEWTGFNGADSFNAVFGLTDPPHPDLSLQDALSADALRANAVAALLNASHPDIDGFPYSPGDVISLTANALTSGTGIDALAAQFAGANNGVCSL